MAPWSTCLAINAFIYLFIKISKQTVRLPIGQNFVLLHHVDYSVMVNDLPEAQSVGPEKWRRGGRLIELLID